MSGGGTGRGGFRRAVLDGSVIHTREGFYDAIAEALALPAHFGRNLDALADSLGADVEGPVELVWRNAAVSRQALGSYFELVLDALRAAEEARDDFRLVLE